ncbi:MAG: FeoB-associated Cys-rich membrane protein, partial [Oscillospiraceae bacterium]
LEVRPSGQRGDFMDYVIYGAVGLLAVWSVFYVARNLLRQAKGQCSQGCAGCDGHCDCHQNRQEGTK